MNDACVLCTKKLDDTCVYYIYTSELHNTDSVSISIAWYLSVPLRLRSVCDWVVVTCRQVAHVRPDAGTMM